MINKISPPDLWVEKIKRQSFDLEDLFFEKWHRLDVGGIVPPKNLMDDDHHSAAHATGYYAVWCRNLRELFDEVKKSGIAFQNFVDIGSGKGKACFYASRKRKFEKIIGVEFSKPIIDIAVANNNRFKGESITFVLADAMDFMLPPASNLVFMFNPFDEVVLEKFIENNLDHFKTHHSVIAYANDRHKKSLTKYGFETIFRNQSRKISLHQLG